MFPPCTLIPPCTVIRNTRVCTVVGRAVTIQGLLVSVPFEFEVTDTVAVLKPVTYTFPSLFCVNNPKVNANWL